MTLRTMTTRHLPHLRRRPPAPPHRQPGLPLPVAAAAAQRPAAPLLAALLPAALLPAALLLAAALPIAGCGRRQPPNLLLVTLDTTRADRLGCYGFGAARTPAIDRLAAEGVRCANAITAAPITLPSHATIMTGLYPPAHGVRDNGAYGLGDGVTTLAERLKAAGYETQAFVSAAVLARLYNLGQGFDKIGRAHV